MKRIKMYFPSLIKLEYKYILQLPCKQHNTDCYYKYIFNISTLLRVIPNSSTLPHTYLHKYTIHYWFSLLNSITCIYKHIHLQIHSYTHSSANKEYGLC